MTLALPQFFLFLAWALLADETRCPMCIEVANYEPGFHLEEHEELCDPGSLFQRASVLTKLSTAHVLTARHPHTFQYSNLIRLLVPTYKRRLKVTVSCFRKFRTTYIHL